MSSPATGQGDKFQPATPDDLARAKELQKARAGEHDLVQTTASKWQGAIAGLIALITGAVGLGLRDTLRSVDQGWAWAIAIVMLIALVIAIVAALLGAWSGIGMPRIVRTDQTDDTDGTHAADKAALRLLRLGIALTLVAIVAFLVALCLSWAAPARPAGDLARVQTPKLDVCGLASINGSDLIVTEADGTIEQVAMKDITSWRLVSRCP